MEETIMRPKTVFCDIDGTLIKHSIPINTSVPGFEPVILDKTREKILEWDEKGYNIVLTTGRRESLRKETEIQLSNCGIIYDTLLMGIGGGDRVLINDKKSNGKKTARAINITRDSGVGNISVEDLDVKAREYFKSFSRKDLSSLSEMFDENVTLRDWNEEAHGKEAVLNMNNQIFNSCNSLSVEVEEIHVCDMTAIAKINILIDTERLLVTDFIEFSGAGLIESVTAYRGN